MGSKKTKAATNSSREELDLSEVSRPINIDSSDFEKIVNEIARDEKERRKGETRKNPYYAIKLIKESGLGAIQLPKKYGGNNASVRDLLYVVMRLAEADPDVAHILRFHYSFVERLLRETNRQTDNNKLLEKIAAGVIIGNAYTEINNRNVGGQNLFDTTLTPDEDGYRLKGTKYFCTGTLYADLVAVLASNLDGTPVSLLIPTNREGVIIEDDWDGIGQKLTGSGTTHFQNVFVQKEEVKKLSDNSTRFSSLLQLYLHGIIAGILRSVVSDGANIVKSRKRTFSFAAAKLPREDPQLLQTLGEISSIAFTAESLIYVAADAIDRASKSAVNGVVNYSLSHHASLLAAQTKVVVDELALKASTLLFDVGGASATKQSAHLDRHWRNIRTLASHNPTIYKARIIGDYRVNGKDLPLQKGYL
ncbi:acyl-CoA dehydrogenase family protein [Ureibacillus sinduriensis]|uniref:acyl-CoA dehydrogenase family protein n=1 Tax=Ureibacillus sinduriensis TaxID=561440 RepID=UPI00068D4F13|nr:acyl-CoA dehydrogenase family protein [Ureibacillus sinduriensis]